MNEDGQIQCVAIVPKVYLFPDCEIYTGMMEQMRSELMTSFPINDQGVNLMVNQPYAISFVSGDSEIIIDMNWRQWGRGFELFLLV